jgi:uncharacterized protein (TIGR02246 family)
VPIAAGTDAGNIGTPHGPALFREFELMQTAGLTPREILTTATAGGARLMGRDDLGQLEPGMQADLVVLDDDPLADVSNATTIRRVVKAGRVYAPDSLVPRTPEAVVAQGRNAFNAQDPAAFLDVFAEDVRIYDHPSTLTMAGRDSLAARYRPLFREAPTLHAQFRSHTTVGRTVVAHETVRGLPDRTAPLSQVVLYRVTDGRIDRVWVVQE